jgi:hypothetical protein
MKTTSSPPSPAASTQPKIMGRDWEEIQAMQQGQNVAKHLPPVDAAKMKAAILSDVARFKIPVAVEVVNELEIELPASYKLVGGTWIHSETPAPAAPCPSASWLPLVPPVGVTDAPREVVIKHDPAKNSYFVSYVTRDKGTRYTAGQFDSRFTTLDKVKDWVKINPKLKLVETEVPAPVSSSLPEFTERAGFPWHATGTEIRRADNDAIASIHFATPSNRSLPSINEAEKLAKLICETLASHATLKADVERLTGALRGMIDAMKASKQWAKIEDASAADEARRKALSALSLAEVGKH